MRKLTQNEWIGIVVAIVVVGLFVTGFNSYLFPSSAPTTTAISDATDQDESAMASTSALTPSAASAVAAGTAATAAAGTAGASANSSLPTPPAGKVLINDLTVGTGTEAVAGKTLTVDYVGTLQNGTKFDSSIDRGQPFSFTLGAGTVIKGWDEGLVGMKVGGIRLIIIPPDLGYGAEAQGAIPANSVLVFEVRLDAVQ